MNGLPLAPILRLTNHVVAGMLSNATVLVKEELGLRLLGFRWKKSTNMSGEGAEFFLAPHSADKSGRR